ncbi:hypothetical protein LSH36_788g00031 [Paralvinella palmiformis]|uniref:Uncharacterized protein n=1 Tax=Paralvinella palmiformis TaxID=53620 RepID=A0AAD9MSR6_9ANNE|nr:hypothetical protein LSH36_788g00031 [Paralvinella palmiformis]
MKLAQSSGSHDYVTMVTKPPKPPCWRDFVAQNKSGGSNAPTFTDLSAAMAGKPVTCSDQQIPALTGPTQTIGAETTHAHWASPSHVHAHSTSSKAPRKHRNRLHRTRSEMSIEQREIPDVNRTLTLAETKPREFGLRKTQFDAHIYIEENTRRCERWLEQVRASRPLEDVHFAQGSGIELEIPDEESGVCGHDNDNGSSDMDSASVDRSPRIPTVVLTSTLTPKLGRSRSRHKGKNKGNGPSPEISHVTGSDDNFLNDSVTGGPPEMPNCPINVIINDCDPADDRITRSGSVTRSHVEQDNTPPGGRECVAESFTR